MARPKLNIDETALENYARLGASNVEIAAIFGCSEATIRGRFCESLAKGRAKRKTRLRELQWKAAEDGNVTMLIWLGKNELEQSDKPAGNDGGDVLQMARSLVSATPPPGTMPGREESEPVPNDSRGTPVGQD